MPGYACPPDRWRMFVDPGVGSGCSLPVWPNIPNRCPGFGETFRVALFAAGCRSVASLRGPASISPGHSIPTAALVDVLANRRYSPCLVARGTESETSVSIGLQSSLTSCCHARVCVSLDAGLEAWRSALLAGPVGLVAGAGVVTAPSQASPTATTSALHHFVRIIKTKRATSTTAVALQPNLVRVCRDWWLDLGGRPRPDQRRP